MDKLIYQITPKVTLSTNHFINVPVLLKHDETPLISIVKFQDLGYTTEIPIYHSDGTYLAKVNGTRVYPTEDGKKTGIQMRHPENMTVCEMNGETLFEIFHGEDDSFKTHAELYTPKGFFVKSSDAPNPEVINSSGDKLQLNDIQVSNCMFANCSIGIWLKSDGTCEIGVPKNR